MYRPGAATWHLVRFTRAAMGREMADGLGKTAGVHLDPLVVELDSQLLAEHAVDNVDVMEDPFASEQYRSHLAKVFVRRAIANIL